MNNMLEYGEYHARIELDSDDMVFVGTVFGINDSLSFHGTSIDELKKKFAQCIDDYILLCKEIGKEPDKEFRGSFNVRIDPQLHKEIAYSAFKNNHSMNKEMEMAVKEYLHPKIRTDIQPIILPFWVSEANYNANIPGITQNSTRTIKNQNVSRFQEISLGGW